MLLIEEEQSAEQLSSEPQDTRSISKSSHYTLLTNTHRVHVCSNTAFTVIKQLTRSICLSVCLSELIPFSCPARVNCSSSCCRAGQNPVTNLSTSHLHGIDSLDRGQDRKSQRPASSQDGTFSWPHLESTDWPQTNCGPLASLMGATPLTTFHVP